MRRGVEGERRKGGLEESRGGAERRIGEEEGWSRGREEEKSRVGGEVMRRGEEGRWKGGEEEGTRA